jgi:hypothetical protein
MSRLIRIAGYRHGKLVRDRRRLSMCEGSIIRGSWLGCRFP